jgi:hypothetical protein
VGERIEVAKQCKHGWGREAAKRRAACMGESDTLAAHIFMDEEERRRLSGS